MFVKEMTARQPFKVIDLGNANFFEVRNYLRTLGFDCDVEESYIQIGGNNGWLEAYDYEYLIICGDNSIFTARDIDWLTDV